MLGMQTLFLFRGAAPTAFYTLSLHDALPISCALGELRSRWRLRRDSRSVVKTRCSNSMSASMSPRPAERTWGDRKSTRLNSSHVSISYAVFCLKKKKKMVHTLGVPGRPLLHS